MLYVSCVVCAWNDCVYESREAGFCDGNMNDDACLWTRKNDTSDDEPPKLQNSKYKLMSFCH